MATSKLPEVPSRSDLPKASSSERDTVYDAMEVFVGPSRWSRNADGTPTGLLASEELFSVSEGWRPVGLTASLKRIKNIPQWQKGLNKPEVKAEWDSFFRLLPKWIENIYTRLDEKNKTFEADEDATDESREINWMKGRLSALQTAIDFAAQQAITAEASPKPAPSSAPSPAPSAGPSAAPSAGPTPGPSAGPAPGPSAGPSAAPSGAPGGAAPSGGEKAAKAAGMPWMLYAAGGLVALVVLSQMNRR